MGLYGELSLILVGGGLPALIWLWLVLSEDRIHPEPRRRLIISFLSGAAAVLIVLPFQMGASSIGLSTAITLLLWAFIEELTKFLMCDVFSLHTRDVDEPLDEIIYLAVTALGLPLLRICSFLPHQSLIQELVKVFLLAHARFLGPTVVHLISSIIIGIFLAETFYKSKTVRRFAALIGVLVATLFHVFFNFFVASVNSDSLIFTFFGLWGVSLCILLYTHHAKIRYITNSEKEVE